MTNRDSEILAGHYDLSAPIAPLDIVGVWRGIWIGKWIILLTTLCAILMAGYYAFFRAVPVYAATTTIKIELAEQQNYDLSSVEISPARLNTEAAVLRSRHLLEQVVIAHALETDPEFNRYLSPVAPWSLTGLRDRARAALTQTSETVADPQLIRDKTIENVAGMLTIGPERGTYLLAVTATTSSPLKSQIIANAVADTYLTDQAQARMAHAEARLTGLSTRVLELQNDLQRQETAINTLLSSGQQPDETLFNTLNRQAVETDQRLAEAYQIRAQNPALVSGNDRQITALETFRESLKAQIAEQSDGLIELQQLRRETQSTRALYTTLLAELQQTQITHGTDLPIARILSPATPGHYVAPRKVYIIVIAALLGAIVGIFCALIARHRYIQADTVERHCNGPIIGRFPRQIAQRAAVRKLTAQPIGPIADAAIQLRTAALSRTETKAPQIIVCTSCRGADARPQVTVTLGHSLARLGRSVLIIDADMCSRGLSRLVPIDTALTLGDALAGDANLSQIAFRHPTFGCDMIAAAQPVKNPADLFSSSGFSKLLKQAEATYDHIIIDAAPVLSGPSPEIILHKADKVILTLREGETMTQDFLHAQPKIRTVTSALYGIVIVSK